MPKASPPEVVFENVTMVTKGRLKEHPDNPRRGNVEDIKKSITENGFFNALGVQKSTGFIVYGNHRFRAGGELGMRKFPVLYLDIDDDKAREILLADNKSSDGSFYDDAVLLATLAKQVASERGLNATLWGKSDMADLTMGIEWPVPEDEPETIEDGEAQMSEEGGGDRGFWFRVHVPGVKDAPDVMKAVSRLIKDNKEAWGEVTIKKE